MRSEAAHPPQAADLGVITWMYAPPRLRLRAGARREDKKEAESAMPLCLHGRFFGAG